MQDRRTLTPEHDQHDRVLIARFAAGDAYPTETDEAQLLIDGCDECSALASDIRLISARTHDLPSVQRPRDFRISTEQAEKLRGSWFDRVMRGLASPGWIVVRPLAGAAAAIGLALVVVGALPLGNLSAGTAFDAPGVTSQSGGLPSSPRDLTAVPLGPTTAEPEHDASDSSGFPAATVDASKTGADQSSLPGTNVVDNGGSPPANSPISPEVGQMTSPDPAPQAGVSQAPVLATAAPTSKLAISAPTAPPPIPPVEAPLGGQSVTPDAVDQPEVDKPALVVLGMVLALVSLLVLGLAIVARRRYSDPLVR